MKVVPVKTGPIGHTLLLPENEVADYEALVESVNERFWPDTYLEKLLAQSIVDHQWRLRRISKLEESLLMLGRRELAATSGTEAEVENQVRARYAKQLKDLTRQGNFLRKRLKDDTAELNQMLRDNPKSKRRGLFLVPKPTKN